VGAKHATPRIGKLDTLSALRAEAAKLYRQSRRGQLALDDAWRWINMLKIIGEFVASESVERRLDQIEGEVKAGNGGGLGIRYLQAASRRRAA
jgi:hypothetical protein